MKKKNRMPKTHEEKQQNSEIWATTKDQTELYWPLR